ncbi:MAG: N,N-dimethylformamidase large subunit, partial [Alphaproteobacteria bacterium]|nr:N,N-dimethylformamidase large subunit [Alphaproteobacteria bacterium]
ETPYEVDVIRIVHADPNPAGPGLKYEDVAAAVAGSYPSRHQPVHLGSYAVVTETGALDGLESFTVGATIWPTLPGKRQVVLSRLDATGRGFALAIGAEGAEVTLGTGDGETQTIAVGKPLRNRAWYRLWACYDASSGRLSVGQAPLRPTHLVDDGGKAGGDIPDAPIYPEGTPLLIAARQDRLATEHFNGKLERPFLYGRALGDDEIEAAAASEALTGLLAAWDFSIDVESEVVHDSGPHGMNGRLVNLPTRGMMGSNWSGREMCWRHAPEEYGAIHFHEDDLHDCGWETDFTFEVPEDFRSGVYGARLRCEDVEEIIPFYVRPKTGTATADVVFLAPTFTYQVYGNHKRDNVDAAYRERARAWGAREWNPDDHSDYAHSTYNYHSDGSGISFSSRLRPIITFRPNFLTFYDPHGSGLRHFSADSHISDWLEAKGHAYDV